MWCLLEQKDRRHLITYASIPTNETECKYAPMDLEMTTLVFALEHFQVYLLGNKVTVYTDHMYLLNITLECKPVNKVSIELQFTLSLQKPSH